MHHDDRRGDPGLRGGDRAAKPEHMQRPRDRRDPIIAGLRSDVLTELYAAHD